MATAAVWTAARAILTAQTGITFAWPNENAAAAGAFVRVGARSADGEAAELGARPLFGETGAIECHIVVRQGTGSDAARATADTIIAAFRSAPHGPIFWEGFSLDEGAEAEDGAHWVLHLQIFFRTQSVLA
jgi:hypothetical protein